MSFGSPCQDWSVAGKSLGLKGHRSSLFHEAIRIIRLCRPRFAIFENVPGLFSAAGGWDFAAVLDEMAESGALDIAWRVLDAQWFGVPQRRRRIFLVADFRAESAGEILSISEGVFRHPTPSREAGEGATPLLEVGARTNGDGYRDGDGIGEPGDPMYSLQAQHQHGVLPSVASTLGGGAGQRGWADDTDRMTFIPTGFYANSGYKEDPVRGASAPLKGGKENAGQAAMAFTVHAEYSTAMQSNGDAQVAFPTERTRSLDTTGGYATAQGGTVVKTPMAVRRLTPTECERLQGFPDSWTDIPGASDSARYRALGNAWAVPVGEWVMKRIVREI